MSDFLVWLASNSEIFRLCLSLVFLFLLLFRTRNSKISSNVEKVLASYLLALARSDKDKTEPAEPAEPVSKDQDYIVQLLSNRYVIKKDGDLK